MSYRLRRQGTGRRRLDGERSGEGGWLVTVPDEIVLTACARLGCQPSDLRLSAHWRRGKLVYDCERACIYCGQPTEDGYDEHEACVELSLRLALNAERPPRSSGPGTGVRAADAR